MIRFAALILLGLTFVDLVNSTHRPGRLLLSCFTLPLVLAGPLPLVQLDVDFMSGKVAMAAERGDIVFKSGKTPDQLKNKNKEDKSGTKKDIKFLRCLSNCKTECQKPSDGLANLDCNQDCQDQCCESYEQCSFKVRTRSSEI